MKTLWLKEKVIRRDQLKAIQETVAGFLNDQVLNPAGEFYNDVVDTGPMGFPTEKREEDLVQLGFPTCNPTKTSYHSFESRRLRRA